MTCRPCLDTYIHTYIQTINQYKQIVIIHKSIETYSYTYTWLQMVRLPQPTHRGGAGTLCVHVVSLCADTKTMTCRPCWDTHILTYQQTDRQTDTQAYIHKSIQTYSYTYTWLHMCDVSPLWGGGWGGTRGGWIIYIYIFTLIYIYTSYNTMYIYIYNYIISINTYHPTSNGRIIIKKKSNSPLPRLSRWSWTPTANSGS